MVKTDAGQELWPQLVEVVKERIRTAPVMPRNEVLPAIYLMDSLVKIVGGPLVALFAQGLDELFVHAFFRMPNGRTRLCHTLDTWKDIFPAPVLAAIRARIPMPPPQHPVSVAPPPEKRMRLEDQVAEQAQSIEAQTRQMLMEIEHQVRLQGGRPTASQLREMAELQSVLQELYGAPPAQPPPMAPMPMLVPPVAAPVVNPVSLQAIQAILAAQQQQAIGPVAAAAQQPQLAFMSERPSQSQYEGFSVRALDSLYSLRVAGRPCPTCALRFKLEAAYKEHLDWHFKQNKRENSRSRFAQSRAWFATVADWHAGGSGESSVAEVVPFEQATSGEGGGETALDAARARRVPAGEEKPKSCSVCTDELAKVWDDNEQEWMYDNAKLREDGEIVHFDCA